MMTADKLLDAIGMIDDDIIADARNHKRPRTPAWAKRGAMVAACLSLIIGLSLVINNATMRIGTGLVGSGETDIIENSDACYIYPPSFIPVEDRLAQYTLCDNNNQAELKEMIGEVYYESEGETWYKTSNSNLKYLICIGIDDSEHILEGDYTLWEFGSFIVWNEDDVGESNKVIVYDDEYGSYEKYYSNPFDDEIKKLMQEYPELNYDYYEYSEVLKKIYNVNSVEDIVSITAYNSNDEKSEETYYDNIEFIDKFYNAIINMKLETTHEEHATTFEVEPSADMYNDEYEEATSYIDYFEMELYEEDDTVIYSTEPVEPYKPHKTMQLTITLKDGTSIDSLIYNATLGAMYENGGFFLETLKYNVFDENTISFINKELGIELE